MKKISIALIVATVMIFMLCACGNQNNTSADSTTETPTQAPTSAPENTTEPTSAPEDTTVPDSDPENELLSAPLPAIQSKTLDISFGYTDANGDNSGNMVIIDDASPAVLYIHLGGSEGETYIYELDDDGKITKYDENEDGYTFSPNAELSQDELHSEVDVLMNIFVLCGWNFTERYPDFRYQAMSEGESYKDYINWIYAAAYTGDNDIWYKVFDAEELVALIAVDPETGIFKYVETAGFRFGVLLYDTEGEIPVRYK